MQTYDLLCNGQIFFGEGRAEGKKDQIGDVSLKNRQYHSDITITITLILRRVL